MVVEGNVTTSAPVGIEASQTTLGGGAHVRTRGIECTTTIGHSIIEASTAGPKFLAPSIVNEIEIADLIGHHFVKSSTDQFANPTGIPGGELAALSFRTERYSRTVHIRLGVVKGVIIALAQTGDLGVEIDNQTLCQNHSSAFAIENGVNYFPSVTDCVSDTVSRPTTEEARTYRCRHLLGCQSVPQRWWLRL
jgi:hypothetical protein